MRRKGGMHTLGKKGIDFFRKKPIPMKKGIEETKRTKITIKIVL